MRNFIRENMCWMSVLILVFGIGTAVNAQDPAFEMHMDSGNVFGGDTFTQTAKLNVLAPADIQGWSLSLCNDDAMVAVGAQLGTDIALLQRHVRLAPVASLACFGLGRDRVLPEYGHSR